MSLHTKYYVNYNISFLSPNKRSINMIFNFNLYDCQLLRTCSHEKKKNFFFLDNLHQIHSLVMPLDSFESSTTSIRKVRCIFFLGIFTKMIWAASVNHTTRKSFREMRFSVWKVSDNSKIQSNDGLPDKLVTDSRCLFVSIQFYLLNVTGNSLSWLCLHVRLMTINIWLALLLHWYSNRLSLDFLTFS